MKLPDPVIDLSGNQAWYEKGLRHREDGPAYIGYNGMQIWQAFGLCHRANGPAVIYKDGTFDWYINGGRCFTNKQYKLAAGLSDEDMAIMILKYGNVS